MIPKHVRLCVGLLALWGIGLAGRAQSTFVYFEHNSAKLNETGREQIRQAVKAAPDADWALEGRASSPGSEALNLDLSRRRCEAVKQELLNLGIPAIYIHERYVGKSLATPGADLPRERVLILQPLAVKEEKPAAVSPQPPAPENPVLVQVIDGVTRQKISGTAYLPESNTLPFEPKGLPLSIPVNQSISVRFHADGFRDSTYRINGELPVLRLELMPLNVKEKLSFANILFYPNTPQIVPESMRVLDELLIRLQKLDPKINIVVRGHVNWPNSPETTPAEEAELLDLSDKRANAVLAWLVRKGIGRERISAIGLGYSQMVFPHAQTEGEMAQNRRVEILLIEP